MAGDQHHAQVAAWVQGRTLRLSGHSLIDTYPVVTRLPGDARVSAPDAVRLIDENFAQPLVLSARATRLSHRECASKGVTGGATYDALVALAAREHGVPLATRDGRARSTYEAGRGYRRTATGAAGRAMIRPDDRGGVAVVNDA